MNKTDQGKFLDAMKDHGLENARMIAYSKSTYRRVHPDDKVIFNANVFTKNGKYWYGDLNISKDRDALQKVANATGHTIYVLSENDGRFFKQGDLIDDLLEMAKEVISPNKSFITNLFLLAKKITNKIKSKATP